MDEKEQLVQKIKEIARDLGTSSVPRNEFLRRTKVSERKILVLFGSYNSFVEHAGLKPTPFPSSSTAYTDDQLIEEVLRVLRLPNSKMSRIYFEQNASVSTSACERRFSGWINTLKIAKERLDPQKDADLLRRIAEYTSAPIAPLDIKNNNPGHLVTPENPESDIEHPGYEAMRGNLYGDLINFRGMQHAPVNEQGVVFLFGMICRELGYMVEIVRSAFPDCEAKRKVKGKQSTWQKVRIEFEFNSRNFRIHGHDPNECDLIVCWQDNWPDCPIEILELSSALKTLPAHNK